MASTHFLGPHVGVDGCGHPDLLFLCHLPGVPDSPGQLQQVPQQLLQVRSAGVVGEGNPASAGAEQGSCDTFPRLSFFSLLCWSSLALTSGVCLCCLCHITLPAPPIFLPCLSVSCSLLPPLLPVFQSHLLGLPFFFSFLSSSPSLTSLIPAGTPSPSAS